MNVYVLLFLLSSTALSLSQKYKVIDIRSTGYTHLSEYAILLSDNQLIFELKGCSGGNVGFHDENGNWIYYARFTNMHNNTGSMLEMEFFSTKESLFKVLLDHTYGCNTFFKLKLRWEDGKVALWSYQMSKWKLVEDESSSLQMDGITDIKIYMANTDTLQWKVYAIEHTTIPYSVHCINFYYV